MEKYTQIFPPFLTQDSMKRLDADLSQGGKGWGLMQSAAQALWEATLKILRKGSLENPTQLRPSNRRVAPNASNKPVLIFAGKGNNGGDGILLAYRLLQQKIPCELWVVQSPETYTREAAQAMQVFTQSGGKATQITSPLALESKSYGLVVDALFGHGFHGELQGLELAAIEWIKSSQLPVLAVDIPSGLAYSADWTIQLGAPQLSACFQTPGELYGQWDLQSLGIPPSLMSRYKEENAPWCITSAVKELLPDYNLWRDKRGNGVLGVMAGSRGMTGAAVLCSQAAMRSGAGMVHLAGPTGELGGLTAQLTEVVIHPQDSVNGTLQASALAGVLSMLSRCDVALVGPGLSTLNEVQKLVRQLTLELTIPLVIDADGLNAFRGYAAMLRGVKETVILTPHDAEWERLFKTPAGIGEQRIENLRMNCVEYKCVIVLKGAPTLIGTPTSEVFVLPTANAGLAKAGSGDVLAGIIASFRAQGASAVEAALLGAWVHAQTGLRVAQRKGVRSALPTDLIETLADILQDMEV